ncbi:MAG: hypothetical protein AAF725_03420 [Acidobacteriota bacterium]
MSRAAKTAPSAPDPAAAEPRRLARAMRGALASLRAAAETLERFPGMDAETRARLHAVIGEESEALGSLIGALEARDAADAGERSEPIAARELLSGFAAAAESQGLRASSRASANLEGRKAVLECEALLAAAGSFFAALRRDFAVLSCDLGAEEVDQHLLIDGSWGLAPEDETRLQDWQGAALDDALRPAARSQGGEAWFALDRQDAAPERRAHVRLLMPLADP